MFFINGGAEKFSGKARVRSYCNEKFSARNEKFSYLKEKTAVVLGKKRGETPLSAGFSSS